MSRPTNTCTNAFHNIMFRSMSGIRTFTVQLSRLIGQRSMNEPEEMRHQVIADALATVLIHVLCFSWDFTVVQNSRAHDLEKCRVHLHGEADNLPLNGRDVLCAKSKMLLVHMIQNNYFQTTETNGRVVHSGFTGNHELTNEDKRCFVLYFVTYLLGSTVTSQDYANMLLLLNGVLQRLLQGGCPSKLRLERGFSSEDFANFRSVLDYLHTYPRFHSLPRALEFLQPTGQLVGANERSLQHAWRKAKGEHSMRGGWNDLA